MNEKELPKLPKMARLAKWARNNRDSEVSVYSGTARDTGSYERDLQAYWAAAWVAAGTIAFVTFMLTCIAVFVTGDIGAEATAVAVRTSAAVNAAALIAGRGIHIDNTALLLSTGCSVTLGSNYPTPSAVSITETADGMTGTGISSTAVTWDSDSCDVAETVTMTVTITTGASYDPVSATASVGGEPPQSQSSAISTTEAVDGVTASSTSATTGVTSTTIPSIISITATRTHTITINSTAITLTTITVPLSTTGLPLVTGKGGTSIWVPLGTGGTVGSWSHIPAVPTNGSFTYSIPAATSRSTPSPLPSVVTSGAGGKHAHGSSGRLVVVLVVCGLALLV
ncbi:hypothetical protein VTI74DRAFT_3287 [Chaetomium olivicolor]